VLPTGSSRFAAVYIGISLRKIEKKKKEDEDICTWLHMYISNREAYAALPSPIDINIYFAIMCAWQKWAGIAVCRAVMSWGLLQEDAIPKEPCNAPCKIKTSCKL